MMPQIIHKALDINELITDRIHKDLKTGRELPIISAIMQNGLNKRDKNSGLFIPCDMGITERTADRNPYSVNQGRFGNLSFVNPSALNKHEVTLQYESGTGIRLRYEGANCSFESITDNKPKFKAQEGVTIEHTPTYKGVSIVMVLDDPLNAPDSFKFSIEELGAGFTSYTKVNGGILLEGPESILIQAPWAEDANGERGEVVFELGPIEGGRQTFYKRIVDVAWLRQATGKVKVDPYIILVDGVGGAVIKDNLMLSAAPTTNEGSNIHISANNYYGVDVGQWALVWVGLSDYSNTTPVSGKFLARPGAANTTSLPGKCTKLLKTWGEFTSTWLNPWEVGGAQGVTDRAAFTECTFNMLNSGITDIPITVPTITDWLGGTNYGVVMDGDNAPVGKYVHMGSSEHSTVPIQFYYECTEGVEAGWHPNSYYGNRKIASINTPQRARRLY
ncbi:MAG: hypothetical protein KAV87_20760 [Desulfobacteraceae bacterium]|nr:hypothetical protein [Desulfobacteraceae bacterium]